MIQAHDSLIVLILGRILIPVTQLFGLYVLFSGQQGPGGGFVGGVILATSMLLSLLIFGTDASQSRLAHRALHGNGLDILGCDLSLRPAGAKIVEDDANLVEDFGARELFDQGREGWFGQQHVDLGESAQ